MPWGRWKDGGPLVYTVLIRERSRLGIRTQRCFKTRGVSSSRPRCRPVVRAPAALAGPRSVPSVAGAPRVQRGHGPHGGPGAAGAGGGAVSSLSPFLPPCRDSQNSSTAGPVPSGGGKAAEPPPEERSAAERPSPGGRGGPGGAARPGGGCAGRGQGWEPAARVSRA